MSATPRIAVLYGGISAEREVSLGSGAAAAESLSKFYEVDLIDVQDESVLPDQLNAREHIVFSTLHGTFGEDGTIQRMLDEAGVVYAGCDAASSALTFDKVATKRAMKEVGVIVSDHLVFEGSEKPSASDVVRVLGEAIVLKPIAQGSSVGLAFANGVAEIDGKLAKIAEGTWMAEPLVKGREATVGVLGGEAQGVVEIRPNSGQFDYASKYTKGMTEYVAPAEFSEVLTKRIRNMATLAFEACGCRDYARLDVMLDNEDTPYFLEINSLPGLKETSLLPMSAGVYGYTFDKLMQKLVEPAFLRYKNRYSNC